MRFLHTADWHLGRQLRGHDLILDQEHALQELSLLAQRLADQPGGLSAIIIAGDLYDQSTPSAPAMALLGRTLASLARIAPVIAIAGNHDHGDRVAYADQALTEARIYLAGSFQWPPVVVPIPAQDKSATALLVLVPYFEPPVFNAVLNQQATTHGECWQILAKLWHDILPPTNGPRVLIAHGFAQGGAATSSERPLGGVRSLVGGADQIPSDLLLGGIFDYAALGHLHRPQSSGPDNRVRYPGSLLPYSVDEGAYDHGAIEVILNGPGTVPQTVFHSIQPRRQVRIVTGTAKQIQSDAQNEPADRRQDYVLIRFPTEADRGDLTMPQLRDLYPNALGMEVARERHTTTLATAEVPTNPTGAASNPVRSPQDWIREFLKRTDLVVPAPEAVEDELDAVCSSITRGGHS
jgi:exonuclease SbcD